MSQRGLDEATADEHQTIRRRAKHRALAVGLSISAPSYRRRLRNRGFSIISNDCWGAAVYQHLGLSYRTPFVGLFVLAPCYLRLLSDLRAYLAAPLQFLDESRYREIERDRRTRPHPYPIGLLGGDVELHFVHYHTELEAREKWERRCARVDFENLFVKLTADKDFCTLAHLEQFDELPFARKLCLAARAYPEIESAIQVPGYTGDGAVMYRVCLRRVNVVRWLNGGCARRQMPWHRPPAARARAC